MTEKELTVGQLIDTEKFQEEYAKSIKPKKMNITFDGHMPARRQVAITQNQLYRLFEAMKHDMMSHVEFSRISENHDIFPQDKVICDICKEHGVNFRHREDLIKFFKAILDGMENPYK